MNKEKPLIANPARANEPPKLSRRLRLGIVGGGRISAIQSMAARLTGHWEITAGALSSDPAKARERGREWFLPEERCYASFEEMAEKEAESENGVDAVMITTPNHLHFPAAKAFLQAGIDIVCDKPLVNEPGEADELVELTKKAGIVFGVGYVMSCYPMIRQAREIVKSGALGEICQIHAEFMQDWMIPDGIENADHVRWRLDPEKSGKTSCVGDIGTHAAHLAEFVSGLEMRALRAEFHVCGAPKPMEDTVFMTTRYEGEVPGTLMATRIASGNRGGLRLRVFGGKGGLEWDMENAEKLKLNIYGKPDQILSRGHGHGISPKTERWVRLGRGFPEGIIEAWANLYAEFAVAVASRRDGLKTDPETYEFPKVEEGAKGVRFIEAAVNSNLSGGEWVRL